MKWKYRDVHPETGKMFVGYYKSCKNGEWWLEPDKFFERHKKRALRHKQLYNTDSEFRCKLQKKCRDWSKTEAARKYDSERKSRPSELEKRRIRERARKQNSPEYRASLRIRNKLTKVFRHNRLSRSKTISDAVGISWKLLRKFISDQFQDGMSWENMGEWHIDHFVPMREAKTAKQMLTLSHYTNLQPLWAIDNLKKGDRLPSVGQMVKRYDFIDRWNNENIPAQMGGMQTQGMQ